jgi:MFS family permease
MDEKEGRRMRCGDYFRVLRDYPSYRYVLLSFFVDNLGNWFTFISCLTITDNFGGVRWTTIYLMIRLMPSFVFAPCLGPLADRLDKRLGMIGCSLCSACTVLLMAFIVGDGTSLSLLQLFGIYLASLVQFSLDTLYGPLRSSLIPLLVDKRDLMITSTWDGFGWSTISAFGASIGGFVASQYGYRAAFLLDALSYLTCALLIFFVPTVTVPKPDIVPSDINHLQDPGLDVASRVVKGGLEIETGTETDTSSSLSPVKVETSSSSYQMNRELVAYLVSNPFVFAVCFLRGSGSLLWGAADLLSIRFSNETALQRYGDKEFTLGLIYATVGLGCQAGPMIWNSITPQREYELFRVIIISLAQMGGSYLIMMHTSHIHHILLATFIRSIASGIIYIYGSLLIQILVPSSIQGRIFTMERAVYTLSKLLSTVMSGVGFDYFAWDEYEMSLFMAFLCGVVTCVWSGVFVFHYHLTCAGEGEGTERLCQWRSRRYQHLPREEGEGNEMIAATELRLEDGEELA